MFAKVQQSTPVALTQIHKEMQHAQLLHKSPISDLQGLQNAMLSTPLPTHYFFVPSFEIYVNYHLFRHHHSLACDVLMCSEVQHSLFVAPIQGHGDMQGHPTFHTILGMFSETLILV